MPRSLILRVFFSLLIGNTASVLSATPAPEIKEILNLHWEALGGMHNWSKVESIRLNGIPTITIQAKPKDSAVRHIFYLCEETYLVLLQESNNGVDEIIRTHYSDYTTSNGLQFPARSIIDSSQTGRTVMTTQSVEIGVGIYDGYFTLNQLPENTLNQ